jgi:lambda repressor-like predicted transcriptional regulator
MSETCFGTHQRLCVSCDEKSCRNWIDYEEDLNCAIICSNKHENGLSLREVALRMGVSFPRINQIENAALAKIQKRKLLDF